MTLSFTLPPFQRFGKLTSVDLEHVSPMYVTVSAVKDQQPRLQLHVCSFQFHCQGNEIILSKVTRLISKPIGDFSVTFYHT